MIFKPETSETYANVRKRRVLDVLDHYCSFRLKDDQSPWELGGISRTAAGEPPHVWLTPVPPDLDTALLRSWATGDCPSGVLADWLEENDLKVPADVLAMLREPQEI